MVYPILILCRASEPAKIIHTYLVSYKPGFILDLRPSEKSRLLVNGIGANAVKSIFQRSLDHTHGYNSLGGTKWNISLLPGNSHQRFSSLLATAIATRSFTNCAPLTKKKDKSDKGSNNTQPESKTLNDTSSSGDPFDFSQLHSGITKALVCFKNDLSKLRSGGRLNPEAIENLRVHFKGSNDTLKVGELAQVVPKGGRAVVIIIGEEELVKPVNSAIIASNLSLTPQPDQHNPLQLNILIPPPTKESREQTSKTARIAMERALNAVRNSRSVLHKRLQEMQKKKEVRPDDIRRAHDQMERVVEKGQKDIKSLFEATKLSE